MKIILLSIAFCAVINTATGQNIAGSTVSSKNKQDPLMDPENNIADNISKFTQATVFSRSTNICGLVQTFNNPGPLTVFLPADSAFNKLSMGKLDTLQMPNKKYDLISMLTYHAIPGKISTTNIAKAIGKGKGTAVFRTIAGAPLKAQFDGEGNIVLIDETGGKSVLQKSDIKQKNGFIHFISAVLMPRFKSI